jgi:hypothetical protein
MRQKHADEDRLELEAHLAERVRAYIELGETPEQAAISARAKFGETERVLKELRWQQLRRSPILWGALSALGYVLLVGVVHKPWTLYTLFLFYQLYLWQTTPRRATSTT